MLSFPAAIKVYLCTVPCDMRRSFDGLSMMAEYIIRCNPFSGYLLVFCNRRSDRVKILYGDCDGWVIWYKAKVEVGVQIVERWIIVALRHQKFFRLEEVNRAIRELLERLNQRPFRKREGSHASVFAALERSALRPLPAERFDMSQWSRARVNIDYHSAFEGNFYSVPYTLVHELVEIRATPTTVELFHKGQRVASHLRGRGRGQAFTQREHRPKSHQAHLEWTPSRMVQWAEQTGPHTAQLFERILAEKPHPEMGYRSCLGIIRLAEQCSAARMEAAAERALHTGACRYQSVKSILKNSLDQQPLAERPSLPAPPADDNIRDAEYFE